MRRGSTALETRELQLPDWSPVSPAGRHLVAEAYNLRIRRLSLSGAAATLAGSGTGAWTDGQGTFANFYPAVVEHLKHHARHPGH